jgi:hypothetical protein
MSKWSGSRGHATLRQHRIHTSSNTLSALIAVALLMHMAQGRVLRALTFTCVMVSKGRCLVLAGCCFHICTSMLIGQLQSGALTKRHRRGSNVLHVSQHRRNASRSRPQAFGGVGMQLLSKIPRCCSVVCCTSIHEERPCSSAPIQAHHIEILPIKMVTFQPSENCFHCTHVATTTCSDRRYVAWNCVSQAPWFVV